jgi:nucleoside-diphosphate-sugar epimerase
MSKLLALCCLFLSLSSVAQDAVQDTPSVKKVLVIGATGPLGSSQVVELLRLGYDVTGVSSSEPSLYFQGMIMKSTSRYRHIQMDIFSSETQSNLLEEMKNHDLVFMFADPAPDGQSGNIKREKENVERFYTTAARSGRRIVRAGSAAAEVPIDHEGKYKTNPNAYQEDRMNLSGLRKYARDNLFFLNFDYFQSKVATVEIINQISSNIPAADIVTVLPPSVISEYGFHKPHLELFIGMARLPKNERWVPSYGADLIPGNQAAKDMLFVGLHAPKGSGSYYIPGIEMPVNRAVNLGLRSVGQREASQMLGSHIDQLRQARNFLTMYLQTSNAVTRALSGGSLWSKPGVALSTALMLEWRVQDRSSAKFRALQIANGEENYHVVTWDDVDLSIQRHVKAAVLSGQMSGTLSETLRKDSKFELSILPANSICRRMF